MLKIKNKKLLLIGLLIGMSIISYGCKKDVKGLVAKVKKVGITEIEYNEELKVQRIIYKQQYGEEILSQVGPNGETLDQKVKKDLLDRLIIEELIAQDAKEKNISVSEEEIKNRLEEIKATIDENQDFNEFLIANDISEDYFEKNTRTDLLIEKYYKNYLENAEIKQEDIEKLYEENKEEFVVVKARHILLNNEDSAKEVLERLKAGEEFEKVALTESLDGSAAYGGDLGYFTHKGMIKEFSDAAFALEVGEMSGLVKTEVGYHIIKLEDKKETLKDLEEQIAMLLKQQNYSKYIEELRNKADIEVYLNLEIEEDTNKNEVEKTPEIEETGTKK